MKRVKLLGLTLFAIFAMSACAAATASAENKLLPLGTVANPVTFKVKSGAGKLIGNGLEIKCTSDKGTGSVTSERLGAFEVTFEGCTGLLGVKCSDLSVADSVGTITVMGEFHQRMGLTGQPLGLILFLILHLHVLCGGVLSLVLGCVVGKLEHVNELVSAEKILVLAPGGVQEITSADNEAETGMESCALTAETGTKTGAATEETEETIEEFKQNGAAVTFLAMI
jgi:hypothetical protein